MNHLRLASNLVVLLTIIFLPYWIYIPLGLAAIVIFPFYWEGIVFGFLIDSLYGYGVESVYNLFSPVAFSALILLVLLLPVREHIRVNV